MEIYLFLCFLQSFYTDYFCEFGAIFLSMGKKIIYVSDCICSVTHSNQMTLGSLQDHPTKPNNTVQKSIGRGHLEPGGHSESPSPWSGGPPGLVELGAAPPESVHHKEAASVRIPMSKKLGSGVALFWRKWSSVGTLKVILLLNELYYALGPSEIHVIGPHTLDTAVHKKDYKAKCDPPLQKIGCQYIESVNANTQLPIRMYFIQKKHIPILLEHAHINTRGLSMFVGLLSTLVCFGKSRLLQKVCTMQNLRWETSAYVTCTCPLQWWIGVFCSRHSWEGWSEDGRIAMTKLPPPPINDLVIFLEQRMVISDPVAFKQSASLIR